MKNNKLISILNILSIITLFVMANILTWIVWDDVEFYSASYILVPISALVCIMAMVCIGFNEFKVVEDKTGTMNVSTR